MWMAAAVCGSPEVRSTQIVCNSSQKLKGFFALTMLCTAPYMMLQVSVCLSIRLSHNPAKHPQKICKTFHRLQKLGCHNFWSTARSVEAVLEFSYYTADFSPWAGWSAARAVSLTAAPDADTDAATGDVRAAIIKLSLNDNCLRHDTECTAIDDVRDTRVSQNRTALFRR